MPIFMDRHTMPKGTTHQDVEAAHHADKQTQDKYKVNFLTYWFDNREGSVFCLVDAPNADAITHCHDEAHGAIPSDVIPVDLSDVEAFLGSITHPKEDEHGNIVIDSALRSILFTDLVGSTDMIANLGETRAFELMGIHDDLVRQQFAAHNGNEIKHTGDGFLAVFPDVADSIHCAISTQRAFAEHSKANPDKRLQVRVGLNAGQPVERGGDLFGMAVNLASRVVDHAKPDQILATGVLRELLPETDALRKQFIHEEKVYFKGFAAAIQVFEITW
jgi:class 3 adenylate cyclase